ncbi:MAG: hypothetical protein M0R06_05295 [Sphaerochaeta sp.]|nr:hypothetical protein [Sphaerochaeta sp.]
MIEGLPDYFRITPPGWERYRSPWFDAKCKERNNDPVKVGQELQIAYLASGSPRFDAELLAKAANTVRKPLRSLNVSFVGDKVRYTQAEEGSFRLYAEPQAGHVYTIGADPSSGTANEAGSSNTHSLCGFVVTDTTYYPKHPQVVAVFSSGQLDPGWQALVIADVAKKHNKALVVPEINGPGTALLTSLIGSGHRKPMYSRIYSQERSAPGENGEYFRLGWNNNAQTRPLMEKAIADYLAVTPICDSRLLDELQTFVWTLAGNTMRGKATPGCHDDLVISLGLSLVGGERLHGKREPEPEEVVTFDDLVAQARDGKLTMEDVVRRIVEASDAKAKRRTE